MIPVLANPHALTSYRRSELGSQDTESDTETATPRPVMAAASHAGRDLLGQALGRTTGLAVFTAAAHIANASLPLRFAAGTAGALAVGTQAFLLAKNQIGFETRQKQAAVALCTLAAGVGGAYVTAIGAVQPLTVLAIGTAATAAISVLRLCATNAYERHTVDTCKVIVFNMVTAASLTAVCVMDKTLGTKAPDIAARNLGVVCEASVIELCKSSFERVGPSVDRTVLNFNGRVLGSLASTLPYVAATVLFSGYISGLLQSSVDSHEFKDLILPVLIGALANAVRGACNAAAICLLHEKDVCVAKPDAESVRSGTGLQRPDMHQVAQKTAVRFFLSTCRNAMYMKLRDQGMSLMQAGCLAQFTYAFFAQNRDLIFDLMQGDGWVATTSEPEVEEVIVRD